MSSLIDFVGDVVSTVLVGDSHDVERLYLLTRDRRVIKLTLQFFAMDIYDGGAYISDCIVHARREVSMGMAASGAGGTRDFAWEFSHAGEPA